MFRHGDQGEAVRIDEYFELTAAQGVQFSDPILSAYPPASHLVQDVFFTRS